MRHYVRFDIFENMSSKFDESCSRKNPVPTLSLLSNSQMFDTHVGRDRPPIVQRLVDALDEREWHEAHSALDDFCRVYTPPTGSIVSYEDVDKVWALIGVVVLATRSSSSAWHVQRSKEPCSSLDRLVECIRKIQSSEWSILENVVRVKRGVFKV